LEQRVPNKGRHQMATKVTVKDVRKIADTLQANLVVVKRGSGLIRVYADDAQNIVDLVQELKAQSISSHIDSINATTLYVSDVKEAN
jgi:hypothetical protein